MEYGGTSTVPGSVTQPDKATVATTPGHLAGPFEVRKIIRDDAERIKISEPRPYAFTHDELADALTRLKIRVPLTAAIRVNAESMADAIIQALEGI